ncbi:carbon-nitrogen hydrolase [Campylobacterota bacterium]|nr:carbon-nitrogen hydrolase [Campylobacterota bacterium]
MRGSKTLNIAVLQTGELALESARLDYLLTHAKRRGAKIAVLPEYVCNLFFKELAAAPIAFVKEQGDRQYHYLARLSKIYKITIISPLIRVIGGKVFKSVYRFTNERAWRFDQQILIGYPHWNEAAFFANAQNKLPAPRVFRVEGFKIALIFGYELHFDLVWHKIVQSGADVVIAPSIGTFESLYRWQRLCMSRAFTGGCYLIRANRIGEYKGKDEPWNFYGNSLVCTPFGEIENSLEEREGILDIVVERDEIRAARQAFGFSRIAKLLDAPSL